MPEFQFVKSTYSGQFQDCVEVARNIPHTIAVRDSKAPTGPHLLLTPTTWRTFIRSPWTR